MDNVSCAEEFTLNLVSNASMETFPGNSLSSFTTLLPTPLNLVGEWQVALLEIAWPTMVQNVTVGEFTVSKKLPVSSSDKQPSNYRPGTISMTVPPAFRNTSQYSIPVSLHIKPGCYSSVESILKAITKAAVGKKLKQQEPLQKNIPLLSWKIDDATKKLNVKFQGNLEKDGMVIKLKSQDLQNILGTSTVIDCQHPSKLKAGDLKNDIPTETSNYVKHIGEWPVDLNAGSHTMFLYCDLVQNETLGDTQTALLRSIPLKSVTVAQTMGEVNHKSFANLQWKRIVKSQFQSISLTLANEIGQKMPFLSRGRTNVTLAFRSTTPR